MKYIYVFCFLFSTVLLHAQDTTANSTVINDTSKQVRIAPQFPGGTTAWNKYIYARIHSDIVAQNNAPEGTYVVIVSYLIDTTGKVTEVKIEQDPGYGTANDVERAFRKCALWIPATIDGRKVKYRQKQAFTYAVSY